MNLAEQLKEKSKEVNDERDAVACEIVEYFKNYLNTDFESYIQSRIERDKDILAKRKFEIIVEFWNYIPGCSDTHFRIGGCEWENGVGYESTKYKGVNLYDIQRIVGSQLVFFTTEKLEKLGFYTRQIDNEGKLEYFNRKIEISW